MSTIVVPASAALMLVAAAAFVVAPAGAQSQQPSSSPPASIQLTGVVRDFKPAGSNGGHADFERTPTRGYGHFAGQVRDTLDSDGKPVFSSTGYLVTREAKDAAGRQVMPVARGASKQAFQGDGGACESSAGGSTTTAANFAQWFRDVPGVNLSMTVPITLVRNASTGVYTFDDKNDPLYQSRGGFFPINGELYGNPAGQSKNFSFTYEVATRFTYQRGTNQVFTFTGDDDVFVFIGGRLVIDLGGVHGAISQSVELDKCDWLQNGQEYDLKLFFAERHTSQSNMRIDTTINLRPAELPSVTNVFD